MIYKSIKLQVLKIKFSRVKINEEEVVAQWSTISNFITLFRI